MQPKNGGSKLKWALESQIDVYKWQTNLIIMFFSCPISGLDNWTKLSVNCGPCSTNKAVV